LAAVDWKHRNFLIKQMTNNLRSKPSTLVEGVDNLELTHMI